MAYSFSDSWAGEIASVTDSPEFQTAKVTITDDSLLTGGEYDPDTNTYGPTQGDSVVYSGRARVIPINTGNFSGGEGQSNATTLVTIRVQIPKDATGRVKRSSKVMVDEAPDNPALVGRLFNITSDLQGSASASRTFDCASDEDAVVSGG